MVAPGGGFFAGDRTRELARASGLVVYLATDPKEAVRRLGGAAGRPLLEGGDPEQKMALLLAARGPLYDESECTVATTGVRRGCRGESGGLACPGSGRLVDSPPRRGTREAVHR